MSAARGDIGDHAGVRVDPPDPRARHRAIAFVEPDVAVGPYPIERRMMSAGLRDGILGDGGEQPARLQALDLGPHRRPSGSPEAARTDVANSGPATAHGMGNLMVMAPLRGKCEEMGRVNRPPGVGVAARSDRSCRGPPSWQGASPGFLIEVGLVHYAAMDLGSVPASAQGGRGRSGVTRARVRARHRGTLSVTSRRFVVPGGQPGPRPPSVLPGSLALGHGGDRRPGRLGPIGRRIEDVVGPAVGLEQGLDPAPSRSSPAQASARKAARSASLGCSRAAMKIVASFMVPAPVASRRPRSSHQSVRHRPAESTMLTQLFLPRSPHGAGGRQAQSQVCGGRRTCISDADIQDLHVRGTDA